MKPEHQITLTATLYPFEQGTGFTAVCNEIEGGISEGATEEEALENLRDAVEGLLIVRAEIAEEARRVSGTGVLKRTFMTLC